MITSSDGKSLLLQGEVPIKFPVALFLTNALMLTTPFVALAETCEPDKSVFNMPLLLFVSLIGATVGGEVLLILGDLNSILHITISMVKGLK